jgi:hypothetical protein
MAEDVMEWIMTVLNDGELVTPEQRMAKIMALSKTKNESVIDTA